jgi:RNA polymerase sigma-70 factor, ECF subfamily
VRAGGVTWRREEVNGQPGARVLDREGRLISVMVLDVAEGQVQAVRSIVNPDKLRHLGPVGDLGALLRGRT